MSEFAEYADRLNMREQLARIDKAQAEIQKYAAETRKLQAEADVLRPGSDKARADLLRIEAEVAKMRAETAKLAQDQQLAPWQMLIVLLTGAAGFFIAGMGALKLLQ